MQNYQNMKAGDEAAGRIRLALRPDDYRVISLAPRSMSALDTGMRIVYSL